MQPVKDPEKVAAVRENRLKLVTAALGVVSGTLAVLAAVLGVTAKQASTKADDSEQRIEALQSTNSVLATQAAEAQQTITALRARHPVSPTTTNAPAATGVLFEGQVTLKAGTGVDLDAKQTTGVRANGPDGDLDVHHDYANAITANGGDLYPDSGPTTEAATRCTEALSAETAGEAGDGSLNPGDRFCLRTSQGRVAWLRINSVTGTASAHVVVFNAVVWQP